MTEIMALETQNIWIQRIKTQKFLTQIPRFEILREPPRSTQLLAPRARVDGESPEWELELPVPSKRDLSFA